MLRNFLCLPFPISFFPSHFLLFPFPFLFPFPLLLTDVSMVFINWEVMCSLQLYHQYPFEHGILRDHFPRLVSASLLKWVKLIVEVSKTCTWIHICCISDSYFFLLKDGNGFGHAHLFVHPRHNNSIYIYIHFWTPSGYQKVFYNSACIRRLLQTMTFTTEVLHFRVVPLKPFDSNYPFLAFEINLVSQTWLSRFFSFATVPNL